MSSPWAMLGPAMAAFRRVIPRAFAEPSRIVVVVVVVGNAA
ncbi:hypothetical protein ACFOHT_24200 [Massilia oculi]|nr:hypothetical protein [Massilia oculi]